MEGVRTAEEGGGSCRRDDPGSNSGRREVGGRAQALLGAPMAVCSGCAERDGGIGHGKRRSRTGTGASLPGRSVGRMAGQLQTGRQAGSGRARSRARSRPHSLTRPACCQPASVTLLTNNWRGHLRWPMTSLVVHFCSAPLVCFVDALDSFSGVVSFAIFSVQQRLGALVERKLLLHTRCNVGEWWVSNPFKNARFLDTSDLWGRSNGPD